MSPLTASHPPCIKIAKNDDHTRTIQKRVGGHPKGLQLAINNQNIHDAKHHIEKTVDNIDLSDIRITFVTTTHTLCKKE